MSWKTLTHIEQLDEIKTESFSRPVLIFKHSTRCSISSAAHDRLERNATALNKATIYYLDLIQYRDISNAIAHFFEVEHESPQVLLIKEGKAVYHASHFEIQANTIAELI
jgi:bacillithiol system protein YtxJ